MNEQANNQGLLFQFASEVEDLKAQLKYKQKQLEDVLVGLGVNTYHQDPVTGLVYKIYEPEGTYCHFSKIAVKRTNLPGEKNTNALSKSEALEQGFTVSK